MPAQKSDMTYIVVEDFGSQGRAYVETDERLADLDTLIEDMSQGQYDRPIRIIAFSTKEADVSAKVAQDLVDHAWQRGIDLPPAVVNFCLRHGVDVPEMERAA